MAGIAVFVSVRLHGPVSDSFGPALERRVGQEGGCVVESPDEIFFACKFPRVTSALNLNRAIHEVLVRDNQQTKNGAQVSIGTESGEEPPMPSKRIPPLDRSADLARLAHPGQNLIGPVAREIARHVLPNGFMLIDAAEIPLCNSISADKISQLSITGFADEFPPLDEGDKVYTNIPEFTSDFIGRDRETRELRKMMTDSNLVTIIGPAGVGKSSIAHWLSLDLADAFRDGSWKVDLGKIPVGGNVATAIAADLKLPGHQNRSAEDRVKIALATMEGLVWLDNCEHVLSECRNLLPGLLKCCPKVIFLVTSRMSLRLEGEKLLELKTFEVPSDPDDFADSEAVRLFINRVRILQPEFNPSPSEVGIIAEICRGADGLPLAIELVAAQAAKQPLHELKEKLADVLLGSKGETNRHRTLERALSWSYSLLSEREKKFFRHLATISGFTNRDLSIAAGLASGKEGNGGGEILDALVAASLVQMSSVKGLQSYRLLEPVRGFALDQLIRKEELRSAKTKFSSACLHWVENLTAQRLPMSRWVGLVARERANLEASLEWFLQDPKTGREALTMCVELYDYWILKGPYDGAHDWYRRALLTKRATPAAETADIYHWMGTFAGYAGDYESSIAAFKIAIDLHEKAGRKERQAVAYQNMSIHLRNSGFLNESIEAARHAIELTAADAPAISMRTSNLAFYLFEAGEIEEARKWLATGIELNQEPDEPWARACQESVLSLLALRDNDSSAASRFAAQSLASYRECGNIQGLLGTIEMSGFIFLRLGLVDTAAKLIAGAEKQFLSAGVGRPPCDDKRKRDALDEIEGAVGLERAEALYVVGALLSLDELYDLARSGSSQR